MRIESKKFCIERNWSKEAGAVVIITYNLCDEEQVLSITGPEAHQLQKYLKFALSH